MSNGFKDYHPESKSSRADKMSGSEKSKSVVKIKLKKHLKSVGYRKTLIDKINKDNIPTSEKHFYNRKRRNFLKNPRNWDKI